MSSAHFRDPQDDDSLYDPYVYLYDAGVVLTIMFHSASRTYPDVSHYSNGEYSGPD